MCGLECSSGEWNPPYIYDKRTICIEVHAATITRGRQWRYTVQYRMGSGRVREQAKNIGGEYSCGFPGSWCVVLFHMKIHRVPSKQIGLTDTTKGTFVSSLLLVQ